MGISEKWWRRERIGREITAGIVQIKAAWVSAGAQASIVQCLVVLSTPRELMWIYEGEESTRRGICMAMESLINIWNLTELLFGCFKLLIWPHY